MLKPYDPSNWFWLKADGTLFSSAKPGAVTTADPAYVAFLNAGGLATLWPRDETGAQTDAALQEVLTPYGLTMGGSMPAPIPAPVTAAQARIALSRAGKLDAVTTAVNAAGGEVLIWFEYATAWERQNQHVLDLGQGIGLTPAQIDGLFTEAATIAA